MDEEENIRSVNNDHVTSGNPLLDLKIFPILAKDIVFFSSEEKIHLLNLKNYSAGNAV